MAEFSDYIASHTVQPRVQKTIQEVCYGPDTVNAHSVNVSSAHREAFFLFSLQGTERLLTEVRKKMDLASQLAAMAMGRVQLRKTGAATSLGITDPRPDTTDSAPAQPAESATHGNAPPPIKPKPQAPRPSSVAAVGGEQAVQTPAPSTGENISAVGGIQRGGSHGSLRGSRKRPSRDRLLQARGTSLTSDNPSNAEAAAADSANAGVGAMAGSEPEPAKPADPVPRKPSKPMLDTVLSKTGSQSTANSNTREDIRVVVRQLIKKRSSKTFGTTLASLSRNG